MRILSGTTAKQACKNRLSSVWASRTEAMQKMYWTYWWPWFRKMA